VIRHAAQRAAACGAGISGKKETRIRPGGCRHRDSGIGDVSRLMF